MSRKRVPPEAQIIALFSGLTEEGQRMVMFGLNAMMAQSAPKLPAPAAQSAGKRSSRRNAAQGSTPSIEEDKANALDVSSN